MKPRPIFAHDNSGGRSSVVGRKLAVPCRWLSRSSGSGAVLVQPSSIPIWGFPHDLSTDHRHQRSNVRDAFFFDRQRVAAQYREIRKLARLQRALLVLIEAEIRPVDRGAAQGLGASDRLIRRKALVRDTGTAAHRLPNRPKQ